MEIGNTAQIDLYQQEIISVSLLFTKFLEYSTLLKLERCLKDKLNILFKGGHLLKEIFFQLLLKNKLIHNFEKEKILDKTVEIMSN